ncbi:MAG: phosphotransferase [Muribaculaceae bacterium]|nr:phosphotransferase [Muribaculaceae bacterium]
MDNLTPDIQTRLAEMFAGCFGKKAESVRRLPGAGSARIYYRIEGEGKECIGTVSQNLDDSEAFIALSKVFRENGANVPEVYCYSDDKRLYLQEDLGDRSLFDLIAAARKDPSLNDELEKMVKRSIDQLVKIQNIEVRVLKKAVSYPAFSRRQVMWDLNYFKYEYLKPSGFDFDEDKLEDDFESFADELLKIAKEDTGFMYRDFQSRNIIIKDNEPWLIDFQGGRIGPKIYDVVSFLWQAKAGFSEEFRECILEYYKESSNYRHESYIEFRNAVLKMALFRTLQVLGAYGLRGLVERKAHFIESIPAALQNLKVLINRGVADAYPTLKSICEVICDDPRFLSKNDEGLTVTVFSFSYKKGYPADFSGNGGGFMFDCRGMHNPGRYDEYKPLTGRDKAVIDFLEERGEVQSFTERAVEMVSPTVQRYLQRDFNSLQIGFGCTGGRHRSVYCAETVAKMLAQEFPEAKVRLIHRELDIKIDRVEV